MYLPEVLVEDVLLPPDVLDMLEEPGVKRIHWLQSSQDLRWKFRWKLRFHLDSARESTGKHEDSQGNILHVGMKWEQLVLRTRK
ncbi:hypothetical protein TNCT_242511 [Trichonephila clavata]|uniref:Uncharacterized protein n=1 Tax=Trichonephila clavata TaxID=2740835 RepID=A0A8X6K8A0_TRICU|nr:hypothetical protein TNCT_242511 [Trichonephila clavata]